MALFQDWPLFKNHQLFQSIRVNKYKIILNRFFLQMHKLNITRKNGIDNVVKMYTYKLLAWLTWDTNWDTIMKNNCPMEIVEIKCWMIDYPLEIYGIYSWQLRWVWSL